MDAPAAEVTLSPDDVRRMTLRAQGFLGATSWHRSPAGVTAMLRRVGAVQLDTISVLARSHELVAYARLGPVSRQAIEQAYWHASRPAAFEYWAHAACVLPLGQWPYFAFRRRAFRARGVRWHQVTPETCEKVLARLRAEGPLTATQLGGAKGGGPWWDWSDVKIAVEWLLDTGEVICVRRTGWRRVYDLPERVLPDELLGAEPSDAECLAHLAGVTARALGVVAQADLTEYHRLNVQYAPLLADAALAAGLTPVAIEGPSGWLRFQARLGRSGRAGRGGRRAPRASPGHAALAVRLADLGPQADPADVRLHARYRGLRAQAQAGARLLRHAPARRRPPGRPGRSGPGRQDPGRPAGIPGSRQRRRADGPGPAGGSVLGRLRRRPPRASRARPVGSAPGGRPR